MQVRAVQIQDRLLAVLGRLTAFLPVVGVLLWTAAPALAADEKEKPFYQGVQALEPGYNWIAWLVAFAFILATVGVAFKNPHRTHLD